MTDKSASLLAKWLEEPVGCEPDALLDDEIIAAIYTLNPERIAAPRVSVDDILGSITTGPLAASGSTTTAAPAVEPIAELPAPANSQAGWLSAIGGRSGIAMMLLAAATVLVVTLPAGWQGEPPPQSAAAPAEKLQAPTAERSVAAAAAPAGEGEAADAKRPISLADDLSPAKVVQQRRARKESAADAKPQADRFMSQEGARSGSVIPEATVASDLRSLRAKALPKSPAQNGLLGLSPDVAQGVQSAYRAANEAASRGDFQGAGDALSLHISAPAASGQVIALDASQYYLQASLFRAAANAAGKGLALDSGASTQRTHLLVAYGDALNALGDSSAAQAAWEEAARFNAQE